MGRPRPLFCLYQSFKTRNTIYTFIGTTNQCPSSIWPRDSNPQPFEHESSPITTTQGIPPRNFIFTFTRRLKRHHRYEMKWYVSFYINGRCQKMSHKNWFFSVRIRCQPKFFILQIRCRQFFIEFQSNERRDDTNPLALSTCLHTPN